MAIASLRAIGKRLITHDCLLCAGFSGDQPVCPDCERTLPVLSAGCPVCALPGPAGHVCGKCLAKAPHFDRTFASWRYEFPVDHLIQSFKFHRHLELAPWFARHLAPMGPVSGAVIIPMPLHRARLAERGFNQALEISRHLAAVTGWTLLSDAIVKLRETPAQAEMPLASRAANVRNAFRCVAKLDGKSTIVVDDVMTTGASLNELAKTLKRSGAGPIVNIVVARTPPPGESTTSL
jgi:ComF family protein